MSVLLLNKLYHYSSANLIKYIATFLKCKDINKLWTLSSKWAEYKQVLSKRIIRNIHCGIDLSDEQVGRVNTFTINIRKIEKMNNIMQLYWNHLHNDGNGNMKKANKLSNVARIEIFSDLVNYFGFAKYKDNEFDDGELLTEQMTNIMDMLMSNTSIKQLSLKNIIFKWITGRSTSKISLWFKGLTVLHIEQVYDIDLDQHIVNKTIQFDNLKHFIIKNCDIKVGIQVLEASPHLNRLIIKYDDNTQNTLMWKNNREKMKIMKIASNNIKQLEIDNVPLDLFYLMFNPTNIQHQQQLQSLYEVNETNNKETLLLKNIESIYLNEIPGKTNHAFIQFECRKLLSRI